MIPKRKKMAAEQISVTREKSTWVKKMGDNVTQPRRRSLRLNKSQVVNDDMIPAEPATVLHQPIPKNAESQIDTHRVIPLRQRQGFGIEEYNREFPQQVGTLINENDWLAKVKDEYFREDKEYLKNSGRLYNTQESEFGSIDQMLCQNVNNVTNTTGYIYVISKMIAGNQYFKVGMSEGRSGRLTSAQTFLIIGLGEDASFMVHYIFFFKSGNTNLPGLKSVTKHMEFQAHKRMRKYFRAASIVLPSGYPSEWFLVPSQETKLFLGLLFDIIAFETNEQEILHPCLIWKFVEGIDVKKAIQLPTDYQKRLMLSGDFRLNSRRNVFTNTITVTMIPSISHGEDKAVEVSLKRISLFLPFLTGTLKFIKMEKRSVRLTKNDQSSYVTCAFLANKGPASAVVANSGPDANKRGKSQQHRPLQHRQHQSAESFEQLQNYLKEQFNIEIYESLVQVSKIIESELDQTEDDDLEERTEATDETIVRPGEESLQQRGGAPSAPLSPSDSSSRAAYDATRSATSASTRSATSASKLSAPSPAPAPAAPAAPLLFYMTLFDALRLIEQNLPNYMPNGSVLKTRLKYLEAIKNSTQEVAGESAPAAYVAPAWYFKHDIQKAYAEVLYQAYQSDPNKRHEDFPIHPMEEVILGKKLRWRVISYAIGNDEVNVTRESDIDGNIPSKKETVNIVRIMNVERIAARKGGLEDLRKKASDTRKRNRKEKKMRSVVINNFTVEENDTIKLKSDYFKYFTETFQTDSAKKAFEIYDVLKVYKKPYHSVFGISERSSSDLNKEMEFIDIRLHDSPRSERFMIDVDDFQKNHGAKLLEVVKHPQRERLNEMERSQDQYKNDLATTRSLLGNVRYKPQDVVRFKPKNLNDTYGKEAGEYTTPSDQYHYLQIYEIQKDLEKPLPKPMYYRFKYFPPYDKGELWNNGERVHIDRLRVDIIDNERVFELVSSAAMTQELNRYKDRLLKGYDYVIDTLPNLKNLDDWIVNHEDFVNAHQVKIKEGEYKDSPLRRNFKRGYICKKRDGSLVVVDIVEDEKLFEDRTNELNKIVSDFWKSKNRGKDQSGSSSSSSSSSSNGFDEAEEENNADDRSVGSIGSATTNESGSRRGRSTKADTSMSPSKNKTIKHRSHKRAKESTPEKNVLKTKRKRNTANSSTSEIVSPRRSPRFDKNTR